MPPTWAPNAITTDPSQAVPEAAIAQVCAPIDPPSSVDIDGIGSEGAALIARLEGAPALSFGGFWLGTEKVLPLIAQGPIYPVVPHTICPGVADQDVPAVPLISDTDSWLSPIA
jgi:hypothetical protein